MHAQQIILRSVDKPLKPRADVDLAWLCTSLGFASGRDIDHMTLRILDTFLQQLREHRRVSSEMLADELCVSASRINHHVRNLVDSGFLYREKKRIVLRGGSVRAAIAELRKDANRIFDELEAMSYDIDESHGLSNREPRKNLL